MDSSSILELKKEKEVELKKRKKKNLVLEFPPTWFKKMSLRKWGILNFVILKLKRSGGKSLDLDFTPTWFKKCFKGSGAMNYG